MRQTKLTDETHIALGRQFGELDDIKPYIAAGRPTRLNHVELFDVSNIEPDGSIVNLNTPRGEHNKVRPPSFLLLTLLPHPPHH